MLVSLRIRDLAIVSELELSLGPGLNVITGETGSGKSILVSAIELVLGGRAGAGLVRKGAEHAEVEALFSPEAAENWAPALLNLGIEARDETDIVLRRIVLGNGRTRAYVNGRMVTNAQLKQLALGLADISSQHEHHSLTDASTHLDYLDAYGDLGTLRNEMAVAYEALRAATAALSEFELRQRGRGQRAEQIREELREIERVAPLLGEDAELEEENRLLRQRDALERLMLTVSETLHTGEVAAIGQLLQAERALREAARVDPALEASLGVLTNGRLELEEVARQLRRYVDGLQARPDRLAQTEERLYALSKLKRRFGGTIAAALEYAEQLRAEQEELEDGASIREQLAARVSLRRQEAVNLAQQLSRARAVAALRLGQAISGELHQLGMANAEVTVELSLLEGRAAELELDGRKLCATGFDRAELLIAPNRGEAARPLACTASGGELSRTMLAIKRVLADRGPAGVYIFDEVDTGVGGATAEVIGRKIRSVAQHHQVVCITHLAPIAVFADQHFLASKKLIEGRTTSGVRKLSALEQTEEVARMLGGAKITKTTRAAARELLRDARKTAA